MLARKSRPVIRFTGRSGVGRIKAIGSTGRTKQPRARGRRTRSTRGRRSQRKLDARRNGERPRAAGVGRRATNGSPTSEGAQREPLRCTD